MRWCGSSRTQASGGAGVAAYDLPTREKIPLIREAMAERGSGLALDVGSGTGYAAAHVFGGRPAVCVDLDLGNLRYALSRATGETGALFCVAADATALPFREKTFERVLCSEVLEHLDDDAAALGEIARVLTDEGRLVISVPYEGLGFTSFLELCGVKTVHDMPGPERHVRLGYTPETLRALLARHGLELESHRFYLRFFSRLMTDVVSLFHLAYERLRRGRRAWTWAQTAELEGSVTFRLYTSIFPALWAISRLDGLLGGRRGFGLIVAARKRAG